MLAAVARLVGDAANQWAAAMAGTVFQLADRQLRNLLKAAAVHGAPDEEALRIAARMGLTDESTLQCSFDPIRIVTFMTDAGVVAQSEFDVSSLKVAFVGPPSAFRSDRQPRPHQPPIRRSTQPVPMPSPRRPEVIVQNVLPGPPPLHNAALPSAPKDCWLLERDESGQVVRIITGPARRG